MTKAKGRRQDTPVRLLLAVMVAAVFVSVLNNTMVNVAIPLIRQGFGVSAGQVGWVVTGYSLVFAVGVPIYGRISDLFSLRRTFSLGLAVLALGSLVCVLAPGLLVLVGGRVLQAVGAAAIPALAFGSVAKVLPSGRRGVAMGLLSSSVGVGAAAGPVLGGLAVAVAGWHSLFYGTFALSLLLAAALGVLPDTASGSPEEQAEKGGRRLDLPGGALLGLAAGLTLFGVTQAESAGLASPLAWGSLLGAGLSAMAFARHIRATPEPFVPPELFGNLSFLSAASVGFLAQFSFVGSLFLVPILLTGVVGLSALSAGLVLAPGAAAIAALSPLAGRLSDRLGSRPVILCGLIVVLASALFLSSYGVGSPAYVVAAGVLVLGVGYAGVNSPAVNAASATLSGEIAGVGLGIYQMFFFLGAGSGPAVLGALLSLRRESGGQALNPLYTLDAAPFSDVFLGVGVAALIALLATAGLGKRTVKESPEE